MKRNSRFWNIKYKTHESKRGIVFEITWRCVITIKLADQFCAILTPNNDIKIYELNQHYLPCPFSNVSSILYIFAFVVWKKSHLYLNAIPNIGNNLNFIYCINKQRFLLSKDITSLSRMRNDRLNFVLKFVHEYTIFLIYEIHFNQRNSNMFLVSLEKFVIFLVIFR